MSDPTEFPAAGSNDRTPPDGGARGGGTGLFRGRAAVAAAAIAVGLVAAVVIVTLTNDSGDESADPSDAVDIASEDGTTEDPGTTAERDDSAATGQWQVTTTGPFEIALQPADAGLATITVNDPATPTLAGSDAQHCVLVTLTGPTTVETYGCTALDGTEAVELALSAPGAPIVGCAAAVTSDAIGEPGALDATTTFEVADSSELPAGDYDVTVEAVTGTGDGCPPADGANEHLATAETTIAIT